MKLDPKDVHDRLNHFTKESFDIGESCQDIINQQPFGGYAFYIFAHARTIDLQERIAIFNQDVNDTVVIPGYNRKYKSLQDVPTTRFIWQPRLTKPKAQTNSMLFKAYPGTDFIKIIWMIPARELWDQFTKEKMTANKTVCESIYDFENNRQKLEQKEDDDLSDFEIDAVYRELCEDARTKKQMNNLYMIPQGQWGV